MATPVTAILALGGRRPERDGGLVLQHPLRLDGLGRRPDGVVRRADPLLGAASGGRVRGEPALPHAWGHRLHHVGAEQSIVEANGHPLHKSRMPVDPRTQPSSGFDFKSTEIGFMAVKRHILEVRGPLLAVTGIDGAASAVDGSEIDIPVHKFPIKFLLSRPRSKSNLRRK